MVRLCNRGAANTNTINGTTNTNTTTTTTNTTPKQNNSNHTPTSSHPYPTSPLKAYPSNLSTPAYSPRSQAPLSPLNTPSPEATFSALMSLLAGGREDEGSFSSQSPGRSLSSSAPSTFKDTKGQKKKKDPVLTPEQIRQIRLAALAKVCS